MADPMPQVPADRSYAMIRRDSRRFDVSGGPKHTNGFYEVSWVREGTIEFDLHDEHRMISATAGGAVLITPEVVNTPRGRRVDVTQVMMTPEMIAEAADALGPRARVPRGAHVLGADARLTGLAAALAREARAAGDDDTDPGVAALISALAVGIVRGEAEPAAEPRRAPGVRRALDYIATHHTDVVHVDDLARAAGMTRFAFLRTFTAQVGDSPYRYLTAYRLDRAAERLRRPGASVLEVAIEVGFPDPSRFARAFAKRFGASPRAWRARNA